MKPFEVESAHWSTDRGISPIAAIPVFQMDDPRGKPHPKMAAIRQPQGLNKVVFYFVGLGVGCSVGRNSDESSKPQVWLPFKSDRGAF